MCKMRGPLFSSETTTRDWRRTQSWRDTCKIKPCKRLQYGVLFFAAITSENPMVTKTATQRKTATAPAAANPPAAAPRRKRAAAIAAATAPAQVATAPVAAAATAPVAAAATAPARTPRTRGAAKGTKRKTAKGTGRAKNVIISMRSLTDELATRQNRPKNETFATVSGFMEGVSQHLVAGAAVKIQGIGTMMVKSRAARPGSNPRTGESIQIAAKKSVHMRTSKVLVERLG
jgi:nucleoid DNA-binding protein